MPHSIFVETTIPSYYVSRSSRNVVQLARQELTREWWDFHRESYDLFTSQVVLEEAADGDARMARDRLDLLAGIPLIDISEGVAAWPMNSYAGEFFRRLPLGTQFT